MAVLSRLFKVGTIADSLGAYVPAKIFQKALGFARLLLLIYLLPKVQFTLWGLGMMIFTTAAPLLTWGTQHGLVRYASFYEVQGQLRSFYRRIRFPILAIGIGMTIVALIFSGWITRFMIAPKAGSFELAHRQQLWLCWAALANALAMVLYHNALSIIIGMRAYRLVAAVEIVFTVVFTIFVVVGLLVSPTGLTVLLAHLLALLIALAAGLVGLHLSLRDSPLASAPVSIQELTSRTIEAGAVESISDTDAIAPLTDLTVGGEPLPERPIGRGTLLRVLKFGAAALPGVVLWRWASYTSFWLTSKIRGMAEGGDFLAFLSLGQPIIFLADAIWAVIFTHVVKHWESNRRGEAICVLETAYKAVAISMMALTILALAAAPLWIKILPGKYQHGVVLLPGLFMFFQVMIHLALLTILVKIHERPWVIALAALLGIAGNVALALWWMPRFGYPPQAAALAGAVGIYVGSGLVTLVYLLTTRTKLHTATYAILAAPPILLLPPLAAAAIWTVVLLVAGFTPWIFSHQEKKDLSESLRRAAGLFRRGGR